MNITGKIELDETGKVKTIEVLTDAHKRYKTLYFENNVDVRLCPKNGNSTLRSVWGQLHTGSDDRDKWSSNAIRKDLFEMNLDIGLIENKHFLFRKNSFKIAVKRNPIERALSSAKQVLKDRLNIINPSLNMLEELLINCSPDLDHHFLSQTYWMGSANQYDEIYDLHDLDKLIEWLEQDYPYKYKVINKHINRSNDSINVNDLSDNVVTRLKDIYSIDYESGWGL